MQDGVSAREVIRAIPVPCLQRSLPISFTYLGRDILLFAMLSWSILAVQSWWLALPLSFFLGSVLTGLFVIGHDCGHRAFADSTRINDIVGEVTTAMALWPFQVWRLSHDIHHRHTHNIEKDIAWVPYTTTNLESRGTFFNAVYYHSRSRLWFLASWLFTAYILFDALRGRRTETFRHEDLPALSRSIAITGIITLIYAGTSFALGGWYGFVFLWLLPQFVFQFWLSTFTLLHHTHPEERFLAAEEWTFEAQLRKTVHVDFPRWAEWLTHDINWHVPHHACVGIPHYHLRGAHQALKRAFPFVREERFGFGLLRRVLEQCHSVSGKSPEDLAWRSKDDAASPESQIKRAFLQS